MQGPGDPEVRVGHRLYLALPSRKAPPCTNEYWGSHGPITAKRSMNNFIKCGKEVCHLCKVGIFAKVIGHGF